MSKTLLYRLLRIGRIPEGARQQIQQEGVVLQEEGIGGSVTFRRFRAPGKFYGLRRSWFSGSLVLTQQHLLAFRYSKPIIGVSWKDDQVRLLHCSLEHQNTLCVKFDASTFREDASGLVEVRFHTPSAQLFLDSIQQYVGSP